MSREIPIKKIGNERRWTVSIRANDTDKWRYARTTVNGKSIILRLYFEEARETVEQIIESGFRGPKDVRLDLLMRSDPKNAEMAPQGASEPVLQD